LKGSPLIVLFGKQEDPNQKVRVYVGNENLKKTPVTNADGLFDETKGFENGI
jgi:hypothetical protein